ncbi:MAG: serine hydrolase domain-containing protein, partial [Myxococcota bacterium]
MSAGREGVPASPSVAGEGPDLREFAASLRRGEIEDAFQALHGVALEDRQRDLDVPGFALALRDGTRGPWAGAFGDWHRARGVALALDQALPAGSLGKPVAGALAMQAVAAGQLELDGSANAYLQRARLPDAPCGPGDAITVRHLLAHRAGLEPSG